MLVEVDGCQSGCSGPCLQYLHGQEVLESLVNPLHSVKDVLHKSGERYEAKSEIIRSAMRVV